MLCHVVLLSSIAVLSGGVALFVCFRRATDLIVVDDVEEVRSFQEDDPPFS